ncbi:MAG: cytochrome c biogenesis CcdA family protein [Dissulfuribacterales bacterium]
MFAQSVSYSAAFLAGLLSFLSPCVLPLIPAYFTFITGFSIEELTRGDSADIRKKVFLSTISFVCGFSILFIIMGASATFLGGLIEKNKDIIRIIGGIIIIVLGIHLTGLIRIRKLEIEKRVHLQKKPIHFLGTFLVGMAFGAGWSPCIGPLLGSILIIASSEKTIWQGVILLSIYASGLALPFILISIFINFLLEFMNRMSRTLKYINAVAGGLLVIVGIFLLTNKFTLFNVLLTFTH